MRLLILIAGLSLFTLLIATGCRDAEDLRMTAENERLGIYTHTIGGLSYESQLENIRAVLDRNDHISGVTIRASWRTLQPERDQYSLDSFESLLDELRGRGRQININFQPGGSSTPLWIEEEGARLFPIYSGPNAPRRNPVTVIPWDPVYMEHFESFLREMAARYASDDTITSVAILGHNMAPEMHMPGGPENMRRWHEEGLAPEVCFENWTYFIDLYAELFPGKKLLLTLSNLYSGEEYRELPGKIAAYAVEHYPDQVVLKNMQVHGRYEYLYDNNTQDGALVRFRERVPSCWETVGSFHFQEVRQGSIEMTVFNMLKANPLYLQLWNRDAYYDPTLAGRIVETFANFKDRDLDDLREELVAAGLYHDPADDEWANNREELFLQVKATNAKVEYLQKYNAERESAAAYYADWRDPRSDEQ